MDEKEIVNGILEEDSDITIISEDEGVTYFELFGSEYGIKYYTKDENDTFPSIIIRNYDKYDYPHIMTYEFKVNGDTCRSICLYESDKFIKYLYSYEEKICEIIERLKQLLLLTEREKEVEFQKEFLYYWNKYAADGPGVFLFQERCFQRLNLYQNKTEDDKSKHYRYVSNGIKLNNTENYKNIPNLEGFYIPITDNRKILPPVKDKPWTMKDVMNIIDGKPYCRISRETYDKLITEKCKSPNAFFIFEMIINEQSYNFGLMVEFKNQNKAPIMERLKNSVSKITPCTVNRWDYYFLNKQIGNDTSIIGKKVAVVGCGSLGSYIAEDLAKVGVKNISLYDSDTLVPANLLRHKSAYYWDGLPKAASVASKLESIHPELLVNVNGNISAQKLKEDMDKYDLIIYTVGSSDVQLMCNQVFMDEKFDKPVMYVWLEAGGTDSHILTVDYSKDGCFECLFTDNSGEMVNNKANKLSEEVGESFTLRNGCGATRVAYGTSILLRTTSVVLDTVQRIFNGIIEKNTLIDIERTQVIDKGNVFAEGKCKCCGNRNRE